jgi:hypothetical protein
VKAHVPLHWHVTCPTRLCDHSTRQPKRQMYHAVQQDCTGALAPCRQCRCHQDTSKTAVSTKHAASHRAPGSSNEACYELLSRSLLQLMHVRQHYSYRRLKDKEPSPTDCQPTHTSTPCTATSGCPSVVHVQHKPNRLLLEAGCGSGTTPASSTHMPSKRGSTLPQGNSHTCHTCLHTRVVWCTPHQRHSLPATTTCHQGIGPC